MPSHTTIGGVFNRHDKVVRVFGEVGAQALRREANRQLLISVEGQRTVELELNQLALDYVGNFCRQMRFVKIQGLNRNRLIRGPVPDCVAKGERLKRTVDNILIRDQLRIQLNTALTRLVVIDNRTYSVGFAIFGDERLSTLRYFNFQILGNNLLRHGIRQQTGSIKVDLVSVWIADINLI